MAAKFEVLRSYTDQIPLTGELLLPIWWCDHGGVLILKKVGGWLYAHYVGKNTDIRLSQQELYFFIEHDLI